MKISWPSLPYDKLERHLFRAADILRGKMNAWDYQNFIFGMMFLKRASDEFDYHYRRIHGRSNQERSRRKSEAKKRAESKAPYTKEGVFFVPPEARWKRLRDDVSKNVAEELDIALTALQNENIKILNDVLDNIHFAKYQIQPQRQGPEATDQALQQSLTAEYRLRVSRPARSRLRIPD